MHFNTQKTDTIQIVGNKSVSGAIGIRDNKIDSFGFKCKAKDFRKSGVFQFSSYEKLPLADYLEIDWVM